MRGMQNAASGTEGLRDRARLILVAKIKARRARGHTLLAHNAEPSACTLDGRFIKQRKILSGISLFVHASFIDNRVDNLQPFFVLYLPSWYGKYFYL